MSTKNNPNISEKRYKKIITTLVPILIILLSISIFANWYLYSSKIVKARANSSSQYPLIDPTREYISQDDFIVNIQPLREYLKELVAKAKEEGITILLYYEQFNTGANISINQDLRLNTASLTKLPEAMITAKKVEVGEWDWHDQLVLLEGDINNKLGNLYRNPVNSKFSIKKLVDELLINSDNTAENIIYRNLSDEDVRRLIDEVGLEDLYDVNGKITAKEYTRLFRSLYSASFLNRENSSKILELLCNVKFDEFLSQGIPSDIKFAHKYGENKEAKIIADSGIVYYPNRPYVLTVIMQLPDSSYESRDRGKLLMKRISQKAYETVVQK